MKRRNFIKSTSTIGANLVLLSSGSIHLYAKNDKTIKGNAEVATNQGSDNWLNKRTFGLHFDFHAREGVSEVNKLVSREMVEYVIKTVHPDYIICDTKGHPGYASYPSKVGNSHPDLAKDGLRIWRDVTAEHGIPLVSHYSGLVDGLQQKLHPEWSALDADDKPYFRRDTGIMSVFSPYVDEVLIPQLKELVDVYQMDGVWLDGELMGTRVDYHPSAIKAFREQTGIQDIPRKRNDSHYEDYLEFNREAFRKIMQYYVTEMHKYAPDFAIGITHAYTALHMPERPFEEIAYLTTDIWSSTEPLNRARYDARFSCLQGKPWDLSDISFTVGSDSRSMKSVVQLQQEVAVTISHGGTCQIYCQSRPDGSIVKRLMPHLAKVADFCRAREELCHRPQPVPQIGLIYSSKIAYRRFGAPFVRNRLAFLQGVMHCLLDSQHAVTLPSEHHLEQRINEYPLLVYPEWNDIEPEFKKRLLEYVRRGGNLLIIGSKTTALFEKELGVELVGSPELTSNGLMYNNLIADVRSMSQTVKLGNDVKAAGTYFQDRQSDDSPEAIGATIRQYGKGKIAGLYLDIGDTYYKLSTTAARDFVNSLVEELFPEPIVEVKGSHNIDVQVLRNNDKLLVNLLNTSGPHENLRIIVFDEIVPLGPLSICIRSENKPKQVTLKPEGKTLKFRYEQGKILLTLSKLEIHSFLEVQA